MDHLMLPRDQIQALVQPPLQAAALAELMPPRKAALPGVLVVAVDTAELVALELLVRDSLEVIMLVGVPLRVMGAEVAAAPEVRVLVGHHPLAETEVHRLAHIPHGQPQPAPECQIIMLAVAVERVATTTLAEMLAQEAVAAQQQEREVARREMLPQTQEAEVAAEGQIHPLRLEEMAALEL